MAGLRSRARCYAEPVHRPHGGCGAPAAGAELAGELGEPEPLLSVCLPRLLKRVAGDAEPAGASPFLRGAGGPGSAVPGRLRARLAPEQPTSPS